jgi:hypothetical protein
MLNPFFLWCYLIVGLIIAIDVNNQTLKEGKPPIRHLDWFALILAWPAFWILGIFLE